ncbi:MAG: NAD(P)H-dependent oxidoreductase [Chlorobi bacterium]|nr:NAD(P)H-dependent oxidoreductase [Chlorobiota bacterium]
MKALVIAASQRHPSQSAKVAEYIRRMIAERAVFSEVNVYDLGKNPLPLWDEGVWRNDPRWQRILEPVARLVTDADAYVVVVPEWNGGVTPAIKNFALFFGERETGHKPLWLVSVSSEINGQYPVADMKAFVSKNNKWIFIPDHTVIRFVHRYLNSPEPASEEEKLLVERMQYSLTQLERYARALKEVRRDFPYDDRFKYAM